MKILYIIDLIILSFNIKIKKKNNIGESNILVIAIVTLIIFNLY